MAEQPARESARVEVTPPPEDTTPVNKVKVGVRSVVTMVLPLVLDAFEHSMLHVWIYIPFYGLYES